MIRATADTGFGALADRWAATHCVPRMPFPSEPKPPDAMQAIRFATVSGEARQGIDTCWTFGLGTDVLLMQKNLAPDG